MNPFIYYTLFGIGVPILRFVGAAKTLEIDTRIKAKAK